MVGITAQHLAQLPAIKKFVLVLAQIQRYRRAAIGFFDLHNGKLALPVGLPQHRIGLGRVGTPAKHGYFRSEEHTSELQSLMRISYAVSCLKKQNITQPT